MKRDQKGFTLIEILIAMVIMVVGLLALAKVQNVSIGTNLQSHRMTVAAVLAQDKMEELISLAPLDWDAPDLADNSDNFSQASNKFLLPEDGKAWDHTNNPVSIDEQGNAVPATKAGYYRYWNIANDIPAPKMKTISVVVRYSDKKDYSVTVDTVVSR